MKRAKTIGELAYELTQIGNADGEVSFDKMVKWLSLNLQDLEDCKLDPSATSEESQAEIEAIRKKMEVHGHSIGSRHAVTHMAVYLLNISIGQVPDDVNESKYGLDMANAMIVTLAMAKAYLENKIKREGPTFELLACLSDVVLKSERAVKTMHNQRERMVKKGIITT